MQQLLDNTYPLTSSDLKLPNCYMFTVIDKYSRYPSEFHLRGAGGGAAAPLEPFYPPLEIVLLKLITDVDKLDKVHEQ